MTFTDLARGVLINLFMLMGFVALSSMARRLRPAPASHLPAWAEGFLFGLMGVLAMSVPTVIRSGVIFDCRSGVIGTGALLGGPVCALISILLPGLYRMYIGGPGLIPGLMEIILPALLGSLCHRWRHNRHQPLTIGYVLLCSLIVGISSNGFIMIFLLIFMHHSNLLLDTGSDMLIILNGPLSMALFSSLLVLERQHTESMELHSSILQTAMEGFWLVDRQGRLLEVNAAYGRMSGYSEAELLARSIADLEAAMDGPEILRRIQTIMDRGWDRFESVHRRKDGSRFNVEVSAQYLYDESRRCVVFLHDITDRKKAEAALRASEKKYKQLIETTDTGFVILDDKGRVLDANQEYVRMTGYGSLDDIVGRPVTDWTAPEDQERNAREVENCLRTGSVRDLEITYIGAEGTIVPVEIQAATLPGEGTARVMSICRDITERRLAMEEKKSLQDQLFRAQKMESIGTLAGGFAHDFNNILSPIVGICDLLINDPSVNDHSKGRIRIIMESAQKASGLIKQMLALGRRSDSRKEPVRVQKVIGEVLSLIRHSLPSTINVILKVDESCDATLADAGQIHQVLINLITNAYHAMEDTGGAIEVGLREIQIEADNLRQPSLSPGRHLDLYVADTGTGMDETIIEKIFDPFFTTKKADKGTGLGLSVSYGIVQAHGGIIVAASTPGVGSVFHVYLPIRE